MADGLELNAGSGGATLATDNIGTAHYQYVKIAWGTDGTADIVSTADRFPVDASGTVTALPSGTYTVSVGPALPSGGNLIGSVTAVGASGTVTAIPSGTQTVAGTVTAVPSGTYTVAVGPALPAGANVIGSVTALPSGTQTVAVGPALPAGGNLIGTVTALGASGTVTAIPSGTQTVAGTVTATPSGTYTVSVGPALPAGGNLIGTVTALGASGTVTAIPSGTQAVAGTLTVASVGTAVQVAQESDQVFVNGSLQSVSFTSILSTATDATLVAGSGTSKVRVLGAYLVSNVADTLRFESATAGSYVSGPVPLAANAGWVLPFSPVGWFEGSAGSILNLEASVGSLIGGGLVYVRVP